MDRSQTKDALTLTRASIFGWDKSGRKRSNKSLTFTTRTKWITVCAMFLTIPYRFPAWLALTLFSLISLLAILDEREGNWYFEAKWSIALASISFGIGVLVCIAQLINDAREKFVATKLEGALILLLVIVWALAIPVIMSPSHGLAMVNGNIVDANLYFASWAAFCLAFYMFANYGRSLNRFDSVFGSRWWLCLFISSCITMTAIIRQKNARPTCRGNSGRELCDELRLGLALSISSMAVSLGMVIVGVTGTSTPSFVGVIAGIFVLVAWAVCVAYLTFDNGPASSVGNLFFGTWISFMLALFLALSHLFMIGSSVVSSSSSIAAATNNVSTKKEAAPKEQSKKKKTETKESKKKSNTTESK